MTPDTHPPVPSDGEPRLPPARPRVRRTPVDESQPAPPAEYPVGYKKPPVHTRFQKGASGNPRGRPRDAKSLKTIVRETMTAKVPVRTAAGEMKMSRMEAVLHKTVELAMKGNPRALAHLISLYGTAVPEQVTQTPAHGVEDFTATDLAMIEALRASFENRGETQ